MSTSFPCPASLWLCLDLGALRPVTIEDDKLAGAIEVVSRMKGFWRGDENIRHQALPMPCGFEERIDISLCLG